MVAGEPGRMCLWIDLIENFSRLRFEHIYIIAVKCEPAETHIHRSHALHGNTIIHTN